MGRNFRWNVTYKFARQLDETKENGEKVEVAESIGYLFFKFREKFHEDLRKLWNDEENKEGENDNVWPSPMNLYVFKAGTKR